MTKWVSFGLAAIATVFVLNASAQDRSLYLTKTRHYADMVLNACADGYHFASLSELAGFKSMVYNTELGVTQNDSGFGIPTLVDGWVRSSGHVNVELGQSCALWTSQESGTGHTAQHGGIGVIQMASH